MLHASCWTEHRGAGGLSPVPYKHSLSSLRWPYISQELPSRVRNITFDPRRPRDADQAGGKVGGQCRDRPNPASAQLELLPLS
ncbi:hypothetical protein K443DRAFT_604706 [Laccaria amethystina LaAM-08-1]|uniref:Uncharacterized protein n=1 Tax=Laccaria amethystina LaAM-08-1 TaxID=1095629 RepID=A0A0C9X6Y6_9AGAR|nr:hypothetical protein K443DRAFT_604706 [Laccaria amethystina LaAM-08-1]